MIVIDVGCATYGGDASVPDLLRDYKPMALYGFDPAQEDTIYNVGDTIVLLAQKVAWTYDGAIGFRVAGLGGQVDPRGSKFPCFDLAQFILDLPEDEIVLKIDAEGAEYTLLPHLAAAGADKRLTLLVVEFHCEHCGLGGNGRHREGCTGDHVAWEQRRKETEALMSCKLEEWGR